MDQPDRKVEPQFSHPVRQIILMLMVLGLTAALGYFALPTVMPVFQANPYLNGFISFVFFIGVLACFGQVLSLISSVRWIENFASEAEEHDMSAAPSLLAPLATLLRSRGARSQISSTSTRSILDSVATRIDEGREITRYLVNLLIFLGLLGTFYGLATTVPALVDTIRGLAPQEGERGVEVFARLMSGLEAQLGGMGVAFASSLLGLAGSLIVGLLELFAGHGQNRFYRELEEWLSSITRVGFSSAEGDGGSLEQSALAGVMDHLGRQIDALRDMFTHAEHGRAATEGQIGAMTESLHRLVDRMEMNAPTTQTLLRVAEGQEELVHLLQHRQENEGLDAESRMRLRSIDVQMLRILEEISVGRQESMNQVRNDMAALARAVRQSAEVKASPPVAASAQPASAQEKTRPDPAPQGNPGPQEEQ